MPPTALADRLATAFIYLLFAAVTWVDEAVRTAQATKGVWGTLSSVAMPPNLYQDTCPWGSGSSYKNKFQGECTWG